MGRTAGRKEQAHREQPNAAPAVATASAPDRRAAPASSGPSPVTSQVPRPAETPAPDDPDAFPYGLTSRLAWAILGAMVVGQMASALNASTMTSSLPVIMREFGITPSQGQWLTTTYTLFLGVMTPLTAFFMTRFRLRPLFCSALGVFALGAAIGALQDNFVVLVLGRVVQACGSGIAIPVVQLVVFRIFPYHRRGEAMGVAMMAVSIAPAVGPVLAGILTDTLGWRSIFSITGAMAALSIAASFVMLRRVPDDARPCHLDVPSFVLSSVTAIAIVFGLSDMGTFGLAAPQTWGPVLVGVAMGAVFVRRQLHIDEPLLDVRTLRNGPFALACVAVVLLQGSILAINALVCLFVQDAQGYSATLSGLTMLPGALAMAVLSPIAGRLLDRNGPRRIVIVGFALMISASGLLSTLEPDSPLWMPIAFQTLRFSGTACLNQVLTTWGINQLGNAKQGTAVSSTLRMTGAAGVNAAFFSMMDLMTPAMGEAAAITTTFSAMNALQVTLAVVVLGLFFTRMRKAAARA